MEPVTVIMDIPETLVNSVHVKNNVVSMDNAKATGHVCVIKVSPEKTAVRPIVLIIVTLMENVS
jgi:hypothetical protein